MLLHSQHGSSNYRIVCASTLLTHRIIRSFGVPDCIVLLPIRIRSINFYDRYESRPSLHLHRLHYKEAGSPSNNEYSYPNPHTYLKPLALIKYTFPNHQTPRKLRSPNSCISPF